MSINIKSLFVCVVFSSSIFSTNATAYLLTNAGVSASHRDVLDTRSNGSPILGPRQYYFRNSDGGRGQDFASAVGIAPGYTGSAIAQTQYRENHLAVSIAKTNPEYGSISGSAGSVWEDDLYFTGGSGTSNIDFIFTLNGSIQGDRAVRFSFDFDNRDVFSETYVGRQFTSGFSSETLRVTTRINSRYSADPIKIIASLSYSNGIGGLGITGRETTDFSNSVILSQVIVPQGISISSVSGTDYMSILPHATDATSVPEPSTLWLLASAGLLGLVKPRKKNVLTAN